LRAFIIPARAVQRKRCLLLGSFDRHEAHVRPRHRLADCLGIVAVVLVGLHVRLDELRRHEPHLVAQLDELARPVMRAATGLHPDQAGRQVGEELQHLAAFELLAQHRFPALAHPVDLEHALCQIDTHCRNLHDGRPLSVKWSDRTSTLAHLTPQREGSVPSH
jgi:hypothetical protein